MSQPSMHNQSAASKPVADVAKDAAKDAANRVASSAAEATQDFGQYYVAEPAKDLFSLAKDYARDKPDVAAMWAFGLGILVGWKLKP